MKSFVNKYRNVITAMAALTAIFAFPSELMCQEQSQKIKSVEVTEEVHDDNKVKTFVESRIYYDIKGNIIEEIQYKNGDFVSHFAYEYDAGNNKVKETEYNKDGEVKKVSKYRYENNLRTEKLVYDKNGKLKSKKVYRYTTF